ncbi:hypothetical protein [Microbacterium rhizophilus]|uniref:hypothetical protein n=1 Tax=Microbacterium rhizophilus TaxID=3138934 RepID=UPI0031ED79A6
MADSRRALRDRSAPAPAHAPAPAPTPAPRPAPRPGPGTLLGVEPGQPALRSVVPKPPLGRGGWPLPTLSAREQRPRRWWAHPAFIVSAVLTFLSMAGMAAWMIVAAVTATDVVVSSLAVTEAGGALHLDWEGPDASYSLYALHGDGQVVDVSTAIRGGTDAWLPSAAGLYDPETCFVVREAGLEAEVTLNAADLEAQGGRSACVADARAEG